MEEIEKAVKRFCADQQMNILAELTPATAWRIEQGPRNTQCVLKIDPIDPDRNPGKRKGRAKGDTIAEAMRMEEAFKVMKDFRFFELCLPAIYGMGRYEDEFDWVLYKYYDGEKFEWSEYDDNPAQGGAKMDDRSAERIAMLLFDMTQVPVEKFSDKVPVKVYADVAEELRVAFAQIDSAQLTDEGEWSSSIDALEQFLALQEPTIYTIQNGNCYPRNMLQLKEALVLLDWANTSVTAVEEVMAYIWILMWKNPEWQNTLYTRCEELFTIRPEWFKQMVRYRAMKQWILWTNDTREVQQQQLVVARVAMQQYCVFELDS